MKPTERVIRERTVLTHVQYVATVDDLLQQSHVLIYRQSLRPLGRIAQHITTRVVPAE